MIPKQEIIKLMNQPLPFNLDNIIKRQALVDCEETENVSDYKNFKSEGH